MNLNDLTQEQLRKFWVSHRYGNQLSQTQLELSQNDICNLAAYALAKSCVLRCTEEDKQKEADIYREHCRIYRDMLTDKAREMVK